MTNNNYNVSTLSYKESEALQQLLTAANDALVRDNERFEQRAADAGSESFTITVNGVQTAFILGGPQFDAICNFIQTIADENGYAVDYNNGTVTE